MPDRAAVIEALEQAIPFMRVKGYCAFALIMRDAVELLKEQEPLVVNDPGAICPNCKWPLYPEDHPHYCGNCGGRVKWHETD